MSITCNADIMGLFAADNFSIIQPYDHKLKKKYRNNMEKVLAYFLKSRNDNVFIYILH